MRSVPFYVKQIRLSEKKQCLKINQGEFSLPDRPLKRPNPTIEDCYYADLFCFIFEGFLLLLFCLFGWLFFNPSHQDELAGDRSL